MTPTHAAPADQAMGLELEAMEIESALEWAEAQGRLDDARDLRIQLVNVLTELSAAADRVV